MEHRENLLTVADGLMERYVPGARLESKLRHRGPLQAYYTPSDGIITWCVLAGLTILLHEIGHCYLRHTNEDLPWRARLIEEVEAWLWAEKIARKEKMSFDYPKAEEAFGVYFDEAKRRQLCFINWRWRPKETK